MGYSILTYVNLLFLLLNDVYEELVRIGAIMSSKKKKGKYASNEFEFVNLDFDDQQKADIMTWIDDRDLNLEDALIRMADKNYKLSLSLNNWSGDFTAAVTAKDTDNPRYNKCNTYHHTDMGRLIYIMLYVVEVLFESEDFNFAVKVQTNDW